MAVLRDRDGAGVCGVRGWRVRFWGCGFFFGKIALEEMSFAHMVLYRFLFAMLVLLPLLVDASAGVESAGVGCAGGGFVSWRAAAVFDSVLCAVDYDGEPCFADGGDDAGDPGGGGGVVCA